MNPYGRRFGKTEHIKRSAEEVMKKGGTVLFVTPRGARLERIHISGLRVITPVKKGY